jgi:hypothetical protein
LIAGVGVAATLIIAALLWADVRLSSLVPGGGAFYGPWEAARAVLSGVGAPYSVADAKAAQLLAYGREAASTENPYYPIIPFWLFPVYFPFALTSSPILSRGVWLLLSQAAAVGTAFLSLACLQWQPRRSIIILLGLVSVTSFYSVTAWIEGSSVIVLGLLYSAILWTYRNRADELCGAVLVFTLFSWEVGAVFLILLAWRIVHEKRWSILAGMAMSLTVLVTVSFLIYPGWLLPFLAATVANFRAHYGLATASILLRLVPTYGPRLAQVLTAFVGGLLILEWALSRDLDFRRFVWTSCLALAATPLLGLRTEMSALVALSPCAILIFAASAEHGPVGRWFAAIFLAVGFVVPWILYWRWLSLHDQRAYDFLFLFSPVLSIGGLYWTRWWFLRPQRTWFDQARSAGR